MKRTTITFGILWCIIAISFLTLLLTGFHKEVNEFKSSQDTAFYTLTFGFFVSCAIGFLVLKQKTFTLTEEEAEALRKII